MKKITSFLKRNTKWMILFLCLLLVIKVVEILYRNELDTIDLEIYHMVSIYISGTMTFVMKIFTTIGSQYVIIPLTLILTLYCWMKKENFIGFMIPINLGLITLLNVLLKNIVQRPRPSDIALIRETGYSFPSGHSMVSMAFYGFLIYLIHRYVKDSHKSNLLILLLTVLIMSIGLSRIYLGVHYASDVVSGFLLSVSYLIVFTSIFSKKFHKTNTVKSSRT